MEQAITAGEWALYSKADSAYHRVFLQLAGNRYYEKAYALTATALEALRARLQSGEGDFWQRSFAEHTQMRDLIAARDFDAAQAVLREHILIINRSLTVPEERPLKRTKVQRRSDEECTALMRETTGAR
jgi:DNA-binding GntR family transcriptional regulator